MPYLIYIYIYIFKLRNIHLGSLEYAYNLSTGEMEEGNRFKAGLCCTVNSKLGWTPETMPVVRETTKKREKKENTRHYTSEN